MTGKDWVYVVVTAVSGEKLVLHADPPEAARPWLRMLERAGVDVERTPNGGYRFTFDDRPDLTAEEAQP